MPLPKLRLASVAGRNPKNRLVGPPGRSGALISPFPSGAWERGAEGAVDARRSEPTTVNCPLSTVIFRHSHEMFTRARQLLEMIRFSHTLFALPFALLAAILAWRQNWRDGLPFRWRDLVGILLCMVF